VTAYPDDWEVHDMLGNAYGAQGDKKMAIEHYSKSLELNPENENAAEMIKNFNNHEHLEEHDEKSGAIIAVFVDICLGKCS
jgi:tetratricopeptide (TPR) repeat protein